ncbi:hypothetical protein Val02_90220 [Virgisporangium aliadipatigenens]|uniref:Type II toxin-antitoxin system RelE/ParE family toxin n=1 Tax=Virgisporangium aliadipatigenens TaxID=741659 RepID=A0A8J4DW50_9ACTN|nr:hypothetical protein Val02_90220 [Virgisporangium aliadipatigenens]
MELEPELRGWLESLSTTAFATAAFHIDLLARRGVLLSGPHTRQLCGALRERRFHLDGQPIRATYWIAPQRRIVLLTVFKKTQQREAREVGRAWAAMARCIERRHTVEEG